MEDSLMLDDSMFYHSLLEEFDYQFGNSQELEEILAGDKKLGLLSEPEEVSLNKNNVKSQSSKSNDSDKKEQSISKTLIQKNPDQILSCDICGLEGKKTKINRHMASHMTERKNNCLVCGKSFKTKYEVQRHMQYHRPDRPFQCPFAQCVRAYKLKEGLTDHLKTHFEYKNECEVCSKKFSSMKRLNSHRKLHFKKEKDAQNGEGASKKGPAKKMKTQPQI